MATYNKSVPQATDAMDQSQQDFLNNFTAISDLVEVNHVEFNDGNAGKHKFMTMPEESAGPTTAADEGALYCKESPSTATTALFFRNESNGDEIEITGATKATEGWTYLPSGVIMMWGFKGIAAGTSETSTFITGAGIPTFTTIYNAQVSIEGGATDDGTIYITSLTTTNLTVYSSATGGAPRTYYYFVIGD